MISEQKTPLTAPKPGSHASQVKRFMDRGTSRESSYHREIDLEASLSKAYVEGHQWLKRVKSNDPRRVPKLVEQDDNDIPKPVTNLVLPAVENEIARLAKRNSETYVDPSDASDPSSRAAAKTAGDAIADHLDTMRWSRIRRRFIHQDVQYGTAVLFSFLEQDNLDAVLIGKPGSVKCKGQHVFDQMAPDGPMQMAQCDFRSISTDVPADKAGLLPPEMLSNVDEDDEGDLGITTEMGPRTKYNITRCLECGGPLESYVPEPTEIDFLGRKMGMEVPKGCAKIETIPWHSFFPENEGIGIEPETLGRYWLSIPRSLDWIKRYFKKNADKVKPEDPLVIAEAHPVLGEYANDHGTRAVDGREIYNNHARVRYYIEDKSMEHPKGRYIVMAGDVVMADDDLYVDPATGQDGEPLGEPFRRVNIALARCFPKDGEIRGQGFPAQIQSLQNRYNMLTSQVVDTRERHGVAGIVAAKGINLVGGWLKGFIGRILLYDPDPSLPNHGRPEPFDTKLMDDGVWKEAESIEKMVAYVLGTMDVEIGNAPAGVTAYSALALLGEKASERRQQREKEIVDAFEETFRHQLLLMQKYYREPRSYKVRASTGWEKREFKGVDLLGEVGVKVREQPSYDVKTAEREALASAMNSTLYAAAFATPHAQREAGKILGIPMSVLDQTNVQMDSISRKWFDFLRSGKIPVVDPNLDDHFLHYSEYGRLLLSSEGVELAEQSAWEFVLRGITGWDAILQQQDQMRTQAYLAMAQQAQMQGIPAPPVTEPPLESKIFQAWTQMLKGANATQLRPETQRFMQFRAVFEAHHMLAEQAKGQASAGAPEVAAPGGGSTPAGTEPIPGQPVIPGPGTGGSPEPVAA